jgi:hypothetical protein
VKKSVVILVAVLMVAAAGCQKKEGAERTAAPAQPAEQGVALQITPAPSVPPQTGSQSASPQEATAPLNLNIIPGGDPHAGLKLKAAPATGAGHKGKVLQVLEVSGYTYLEVEEKGQKLWVAAIKTKVSKGDVVEFPDSRPMENFQSKTLKRTFDKIFFADALRVVK